MSHYRSNKKKLTVSEYGGLGLMEDVPFQMQFYSCSKCGTQGALGHSARCKCAQGSKFKALKVIVDGKKFDSKAEAMRFAKLSFMQHRNIISHLELQPKFTLEVNQKKICTYKGDFRYRLEGKTVVEDVKGFITPVFSLKLKLLKALFPGIVFDIL